MSSLDDFCIKQIDCPSGASIYSVHRDRRNAGSVERPLIVLLHGYPQNHLMFKDFVQEIPVEWSILIPDLPGYNLSTKPVDPSGQSRAHSKKEWAKDIVHVVDTIFGPSTPIIAYGHDRGARLSYRIALDYPERVVGSALLDIVPTSYVWDAMRLEKGHKETRRSEHWIFLSSKSPLPETMIASNPAFYYRYTIDTWTGSKAKATSESAHWVIDSIQPFLDAENGKARIEATCEDYRAGSSLDIQDDYASGINPLFASASPVFSIPLLVLSAHRLRNSFDVDKIWSVLGTPGSVQSYQVGDETTGHFIVNEAQNEVGERTRRWLEEYWTLGNKSVRA